MSLCFATDLCSKLYTCQKRKQKKLEYFLASIEVLIYQFRFLHPSVLQAYTYYADCCFHSRKSFFIILPGTTPPPSHPVIVFIRSTLRREMYMIRVEYNTRSTVRYCSSNVTGRR